MAIQAKKRCGGVLRGPAVTVLFILSIALTGCSAFKEVGRAVSDSSRAVTGVFASGDSGFKKKIVLVGVEKKLQPGFPSYFVGSAAGRLQKECREAVIAAPSEINLTSRPTLPSGELDGFALALLGRQQGVNYFVFGTLNDLRFIEEKKGFWWWKDNRYALRAVIRVEIIDSASGAKSLDDSFWQELELDEIRYQELKDAATVPLTAITSILDKLLNKAGSRICATVRGQPWQGFIAGTDGDRIRISSGAGVGLAVGRTLEVFAKGQTMETKDGRRYLGPGLKIGEATISAVTDGRAEATLKAEGLAGQADAVRLKR